MPPTHLPTPTFGKRALECGMGCGPVTPTPAQILSCSESEAWVDLGEGGKLGDGTWNHTLKPLPQIWTEILYTPKQQTGVSPQAHAQHKVLL